MTDDASGAPLWAAGVRKRFVVGGVSQRVLDGVDLRVESGEAVGVVGVSGAGKSTLLHILGGLDAPDEGAVRLDGMEMTRRAASADDLAAWRNRRLGFVFQFHYLLAEFSALENAAMPLLIRRVPRREALAAAMRSLERLGLGAHARKTPSQLSGGERQRAAVARALAGGPACVLADEPTGSLDRRNADAVFDLLLARVREDGAALVVASHDERLAARLDRRLALVDGKLLPVA